MATTLLPDQAPHHRHGGPTAEPHTNGGNGTGRIPGTTGANGVSGVSGKASTDRVIDRTPPEEEPAPVRRLSVGLDQLRDHYDVVVVGSGYGGAIAAARLASAGHRVCVLERGRELQPGEFPDSLWRGVRQFQWRTGAGRHGRRTGLFDVRVDHDVSLLVGCGLGGTSLINAGVAIRPPGWVFDDERWPAPLRGEGGAPLAPYFRRAEEMLGVSPYPEKDDGWPRLPKLDALTEVASAVGGELQRPALAINFEPGASRFGVEQSACQLCGDCVSGCNYGAKNTVTTNYLPLAVDRGAHVLTEAEVETVLPSPLGGWTVTFTSLADGRSRYRAAPSLFVRADTVVLAAGTLGSTEILFRSRAAGLAVSPRLGHAFTSNGDALAVAYEADRPVRGVGLGRTLPTPETAVGPCITGSVLVPGDAGPAVGEAGHAAGPSTGTGNHGGRHDLVIQEGAIPRALRPLMPASLAVAAVSDDGGGPLDLVRRLARRARAGAASLLATRRGGASPVDRTLTYLLMGDDGGQGRLEPDGSGLAIEWTGAGDHPIFARGRSVLDKASAALGAELILNPLATPVFHNSVLSVHPLGGCPMGDSGVTGVVDDRGRVFTGESGAVHEGLLVADGAVVPRPLTVNPLLTISALAERASDLLVRDLADRATRNGRPAGGGPRDSQREAPAPDGAALARSTPGRAAPPGLRFTERMRGFVGPIAGGEAPLDAEDLVAATRAGERRGRADGTAIEFVLTVAIDDLPALLADPSRPGRLAGTVVAPLLSPRRLRVVDGRFTLVREDATHVDTWHMRYVMDLLAEDGRRFRLDGTKFLHDRAGLDAWSDTTTLHVTIAELPARPSAVTEAPTGQVGEAPAGLAMGTPNGASPEAASAPLVAAGVMTLNVADFARQLTSMKVTGVERRRDRLRWLARFDARFLGSLWHVYGGPLDDIGDLPERIRTSMPLTGSGRRKLRLPAPEPRWCDRHGRWHEGDDLGPDAWLRLVRFEGGRRGPVLLAPGFGMSATSFLIDTVETNLAEHLVDKGYDVWVFDYRAGMDLPSSHSSFTIDDVATQDWPVAVEEVLRITGAGSVQVVGHCFGSMTLMMALAAGLRDVRSAVCMQVTLHPAPPILTQVKASLGISQLLRHGLGMKAVAPLRGRTVGNAMLDLALRAVPLSRDERCGKALCRWINAIYGITHCHDQLNDATHDLLDQLFGAGSLTGIEHGRKIFQRRAVYADDGSDAYLAHPERLGLPLLLVHGRRNPIFHPEGSLRTLQWLQGANDPSLYDRVVLRDYGHLDAVIGRDAARDVYPVISRHLDRFNR